MRELDSQQIKQINGGWVWVAVGAAASTVSYLASPGKKSWKGAGVAAVTGAAGGGYAKMGGMALKAGKKILAGSHAVRSVGSSVIGANNPY